jgi:hypothetical protein
VRESNDALRPRKGILIVRLGDAPDKFLNWPLVSHDVADELK